MRLSMEVDGRRITKGVSSLLAYCLELTSMVSASEQLKIRIELALTTIIRLYNVPEV